MKRNKMKLWAAEFTLALGCKLNCFFCPQKILIDKYIRLFGNATTMNFDSFKIILDKIEPGANLSFGGMVEPFSNPLCSKMIKYAYSKGFGINLATTLEGATLDDFEEMKDVCFLGIRLHIPDMEGNSKFSLSDEWFEVFQKVSARSDVYSYHCHGTVHDSVKKYLNPQKVVNNNLMNRAGNLDYEGLQTYCHKGRIICDNAADGRYDGFVPSILPNGTVLLCCMDYGMDHILGNLLQQDWKEIVTGDEYLRVEKGMDDDSLDILCRKCPVASKREASPWRRESNLRAPNAFRVWHQMAGIEEAGELEKKVLDKIKAAKKICVFGLGKLFRDNYFQSCWHNVVPADLFSDNDKTKWNTEICGIPCVPPEKLQKEDTLLVVTYVKDDNAIREQLNSMGVTNIINIYDIYNMRDIE